MDRGRLIIGILLIALLLFIIGVLTGAISTFGTHLPKGFIYTN